MSPTAQQQTTFNKRMLLNSCVIFGACSMVLLALCAQAQQYNAYDSDSNSDSDESPILANGELGKLVLNSASRGQRNNNHEFNQQHQQLGAAATRNLYNRQQAMQYAPTHNRRNYGLPSGELGGGGFGPGLGAAATGGRAYTDEDSAAFGPNSFNSNGNSNNDDDDDGGDGEGSAADGQPLNLNQAASGYPAQADYSNAGAGFNFGGASGYGPSAEGSEFGSADGFGNDGRRYKSASTLTGAGNFAGAEDDVAAGALQYGPNSAINSAGGEGDDEGRSGYSPEGQGDDNDDD